MYVETDSASSNISFCSILAPSFMHCTYFNILFSTNVQFFVCTHCCPSCYTLIDTDDKKIKKNMLPSQILSPISSRLESKQDLNLNSNNKIEFRWVLKKMQFFSQIFDEQYFFFSNCAHCCSCTIVTFVIHF